MGQTPKIELLEVHGKRLCQESLKEASFFSQSQSGRGPAPALEFYSKSLSSATLQRQRGHAPFLTAGYSRVSFYTHQFFLIVRQLIKFACGLQWPQHPVRPARAVR